MSIIPSLEDIAYLSSNSIQFLHTFFDFILNCISITPAFFLFISITVIIIMVIVLYMAKPVPGSEGISDIPGAIYIPPTYYGEPVPGNKMPSKYDPSKY
jgi:hypothetical protein